MNGKRHVRGFWFGLILSVLAPSLGHAWGEIGHRAAVQIAIPHLSPKAVAGIQGLLDGGLTEFVDTAMWADEVAWSTWPESLLWHDVEIPHGAAGYDRARDCPDDNCAVERIKLFAAVLADPTRPRQERAVALKMVGHLVADLHVPLHAYKPDGNWTGWEGPWIRIGEETDQLHAWWDDGFVFYVGPDSQEVAEDLLAEITDHDRSTWIRSTPENWADESHIIARDFIIRHNLIDTELLVSNTEGNPLELSQAVLEEAKLTVARRLQMAGVRLAAMLNAAFE